MLLSSDSNKVDSDKIIRNNEIKEINIEIQSEEYQP